jgi:SAM-dependent methyltransferase
LAPVRSGLTLDLVLAELLGDGAIVHAVDTDPRALSSLQREARARFPRCEVRLSTADLTSVTGLPRLDGILAANSLHYVRDLAACLARLQAFLKPGGRFILVEYDIQTPSPWVPYPLPFDRWQREAARAGLTGTRLLGRRPSRFQREMYAAVSESPYSPLLATGT